MNLRSYIIIFFIVLGICQMSAQDSSANLQQDSLARKVSINRLQSNSTVSSSTPYYNKVEPNKFIPSPDAYSIMQYSEFPVSLYNGTADISIPIYTIEVGDWQLPISLHYNTSGIKVAQEASRVGLGWSLYAGGAINRVIRDLDDFNWGFNEPSSPGYAPHEFDGEPDVFFYHFGTYSGKFFAKRGNGQLFSPTTQIICSNPEDNLRFEYNGNNTFKITTPDNTEYTFGAIEITQTHTIVGYTDPPSKVLMIDNADMSFTDQNMESFLSDNYMPTGLDTNTRTYTSWYLTKIKYPTNEEIILTYNTLYNSYMSPVRKHYTCYSTLDSQVYANLSDYNLNNVLNFFPKDKAVVSMEVIYKQPELSKIKWKNGEIRLLNSNYERKDIRPYHRSDNGSVTPMHTLEKIQLFNNSGEVLQSHQFYFSYFSGTEGASLYDNDVNYLYARLKLDSVSIQGSSNRKLWYRMSYDQSDFLPKKNTLYTDRWGYYPGEKKNTIPFDPYISPEDLYAYRYKCIPSNDSQSPNNPYPGLEKDYSNKLLSKGDTISTVPITPISSDAAKVWSLTELTSPTGGRTEFTYESNRVYSNQKIWHNTDSIPAMNFTKDYWDEYHYDKLTQKDTIVYCPFNSGYVEVECIYDGGSMNYETDTSIISISGTSVVQVGIPQGVPNTGNAAHEQYSFTIKGFFDSAGNKTITLRQNPDDFARLRTSIRFYEGYYYDDPLRVGGLRVKQVKSPISTTKYRYQDDLGKESGRIVRNVISSNLFWNHLYGYNENIALITAIEFNTSPRAPLENPYTGNFIGYSSIYTEKITGNDTIVDSYKFINEDEPIVGVLEVGSSVPLNGKLLEHKIFSHGDVVFKEHYDYMSEKTDSIIADNGTKQGWIHTYPTYSCFNKLIQKNTFEYGLAPTSAQTPIERTETYFYHPQIFLPNKILTLYGGLHEVRHEIKYSVDFPNYQNGWFNNHSLKCIPVEETFYRDNVLNKRLLHLHNKVNYPQLWREYIFKDTIPTFNGDASISYGPPDATFTYSDNRLIRTLNRGQQPTIIIWGYYNQYPIAFIKNASIQDMSNVGVNFRQIALKEQPSSEDWQLLYSLSSLLPNAEVSIYEYQPLVGMVKMTSPDGQVTLYTYDDFLRLKDVIEKRNGDEYLRQRYEYMYSDELE